MDTVDPQVSRFQEFLRIPSISSEGPKGVYQAAVDWLLLNLGKSLEGTKTSSVVESYIPGKPVLVFSIPGSDPTLPAILLNSHYDVVPADASSWNHDPWAAVRTPDGNIYGRGAQDMKCVCIQYLEAVRRIFGAVVAGTLPAPKRTIILSYLPDEEVGGMEGAGFFVESPLWKQLNVGLVLDEGLANPQDKYTIFYGERAPWWVKIVAEGPVGHGSRFVERTAIEKLTELLVKVYKFRSEQEKLLHGEAGCKHANAKRLGDVVTMNVTALKAGIPKGDGFCVNVIPAEAIAAIDIRIPPNVPLNDIEDILKEW